MVFLGFVFERAEVEEGRGGPESEESLFDSSESDSTYALRFRRVFLEVFEAEASLF